MREVGLGGRLAGRLAPGTWRLPADTVFGGANVVRLGLVGERDSGEGCESTISGTTSPGVAVFGGLIQSGMVLPESLLGPRSSRSRWIGDRMCRRLGGSFTLGLAENKEKCESAVGRPNAG